jgi:uncharacterized protein
MAEEMGAAAPPVEAQTAGADVPAGGTAAEAAQRWEPVQPEERIALIDALRGLALFGIIAANMRGFAGPLAAYFHPSLVWQTRTDFWVQAFVDTFIQGKFITLFAFLFGVGFVLQFTRAEARQARFVPTYRRRLFALILLGGLHQLLFWWGDILVSYGLGGFLLILFRKRQNKTILRWALLLMLLPGAGMSGLILFRTIKPQTPQRVEEGRKRVVENEKKNQAELRKTIQVYQTGSYVQIFRARLGELAQENQTQPGAVALTLPIFLLGLWVFRQGIFQDPAGNRRRLRQAMVLGLLIGIPANVAAVWLQHLAPPPTSAASLTPLLVIAVTLNLFARPVLSMGYAGAVALLFLNETWRSRLMPFAAIGRTALSNYLLQSIVCTTIFYGYGGGLFGRVHLAMLFVLSVVIYAIEAPLSQWWLRRYRFGPAEWLWRTMTYGKPPAMKLAALVPETSSV